MAIGGPLPVPSPVGGPAPIPSPIIPTPIPAPLNPGGTPVVPKVIFFALPAAVNYTTPSQTPVSSLPGWINGSDMYMAGVGSGTSRVIGSATWAAQLGWVAVLNKQNFILQLFPTGVEPVQDGDILLNYMPFSTKVILSPLPFNTIRTYTVIDYINNDAQSVLTNGLNLLEPAVGPMIKILNCWLEINTSANAGTRTAAIVMQSPNAGAFTTPGNGFSALCQISTSTTGIHAKGIGGPAAFVPPAALLGTDVVTASLWGSPLQMISTDVLTYYASLVAGDTVSLAIEWAME